MLTRRRQRGGARSKKKGTLRARPIPIVSQQKKIRSSKRRTYKSPEKYRSFEPVLSGLTKLVSHASIISGYNLKRNKKTSKRARNVIEPLTAEKQCIKAIGNPSADETCWICGYQLYSDKKSIFGPVCEHVLPVLGATIYLSLVKSLRENVKEEHKLEYKWAHILCNKLKSDHFLITYNEDVFVTDTKNCRILLHNINQKFKSKNIPPIDVEEQLNEMKTSTLEPICEFLNSGFEGQHNLLLLAGASGLVNTLEKKKVRQKSFVPTLAGIPENDKNTNNNNTNNNNIMNFR